MVEIIDKKADSRNSTFSVEQVDNYLKILKEQKKTTYEMKVFLFDKEVIDAIRNASTFNEKKSIIEKICDFLRNR